MILLSAIGLSVTGDLMAQKDTIQLESVTVKGFAPERFMSGLKIQKIDATTLTQFRFQNIGDLLSFSTPIAIKSYGAGQLSTASFRGTSANHTAVLWNGLNINSPTLGQTDFSTIPVAGFDQLSIQYGAAASVVGTDAVGGSILLGSTAQSPGLNLSIGRQQESFGNSQVQATARYGAVLNGEGTLSGKTAFYYGVMKNHFPYSERSGYPVLPSETFQKGFIQDLFLPLKNSGELSAHIWLTKNDLTLTPENTGAREVTKTEAYRTMVRYAWKDFVIRTSWVRDVIDYATGDYTNLDHAVTDRITNRIEKDFYRTWKHSSIQLKAGAEWTNYQTRVPGYYKPGITENRGDVFLLSRWHATAKWLISANLRQAFVRSYHPPFTPSFGTEYQLVETRKYRLKLKGSYAGSYRVPTLNERYWDRLGNPDIKPENGWNKEIGLEQTHGLTTGHTFTASVAIYHNRVKNWTYWNPAKNYKVENLQEVISKGVEVQAAWRAHTALWKGGANLGYALTRSAQQKIYDSYAADIVGKQLVFVPVNSGNLTAFAQYRRIRLTSQIQSVGKRFKTFDNTQFFEPYTLANLLAETTFDWHKIRLRIQGQINNLGDMLYLSVRDNAMPGRSFAVNLVITYD